MFFTRRDKDNNLKFFWCQKIQDVLNRVRDIFLKTDRRNPSSTYSNSLFHEYYLH